jgi:addiction module HigA family antidote
MIVFAGPSHPGRALKDLYLDPLNMSAGALAARIEISGAWLVHLVKGEAAMSADAAVRLARFFGTTAEYWMNLQRDYDLNAARRRVDAPRIVPLKGA